MAIGDRTYDAHRRYSVSRPDASIPSASRRKPAESHQQQIDRLNGEINETILSGKMVLACKKLDTRRLFEAEMGNDAAYGTPEPLSALLAPFKR
jgi:hypothetical protein